MISQKKQPLAVMLIALAALFSTVAAVRLQAHSTNTCDMYTTCPVFDSTASGFSATGHEGGGLGGGSVTKLTDSVTGQSHKADDSGWDWVLGWLVGKALDAGWTWEEQQHVPQDACGGQPCGGGSTGGW